MQQLNLFVSQFKKKKIEYFGRELKLKNQKKK